LCPKALGHKQVEPLLVVDDVELARQQGTEALCFGRTGPQASG
jgi:hypothetical protein